MARDFGGEYTLCHRQHPVADITLNSESGYIERVTAVHDAALLPVGVSPVSFNLRADLGDWWLSRSIPRERPGLAELLAALGVPNPAALAALSLGLSLTDQYWLRPAGSALRWEDVNFFDNDFGEDIGDILFGGAAADPDISSPDATSDGALRKRWVIRGGKRCLVKGGTPPFREQPFGEVIAYRIATLLGIPHVKYTLVFLKERPYCVCGDFVTRDTELVPAYGIYKTLKKSNSDSVYTHFLRCCDALGIKNAAEFLSGMIVLDYIIANEDRHFGNFGVLRDAETLNWLGFAPLYDSGSSLGFNKTSATIRLGKDIVCKPFRRTHTEQLELAGNLSRFDFGAPEDIAAIIENVFSRDTSGEYIDADRAAAITESVVKRAEALKRRQSG